MLYKLPVVEIASLDNLPANQSARLHDLVRYWVDIGTAVDPIILVANLWSWRSYCALFIESAVVVKQDSKM
jgi:hypothetical protein